MQGAPLTSAAALALSVTLAVGTPVPRVVDVDEGACQTLCQAAGATSEWAACPPEAPAAVPCCGTVAPDAEPASPDFASGPDPDCETCLLCRCGQAVPAPPAPALQASPAQPRAPGAESSLASVVKEPASPPPRTA